MKTLLLVVLAALLAAASAIRLSSHEVATQWNSFRAAHTKAYASPLEEEFRRKIFAENLHRIREHNARFHQGLETYTVGINKFADMLVHEVVSKLNVDAMRQALNASKVHFADPTDPAVDRINWQHKGYVTDVKQQGQCGSCWAFSTTGSLEGQLYKKTGKLVPLSQQNLVDCSKKNQGCDGGLMTLAFEDIKAAGGIMSAKDYPYKGRADKCYFDASLSVGTVTGFVEVNPTEKDLKDAVGKVGPVSVAIYADFGFTFYNGGIYYLDGCSNDPEQLNHGVLAVGYGSTFFHGDFWIIKNSWGQEWGENGFGRMARNKNNHCGIATMACYPTV